MWKGASHRSQEDTGPSCPNQLKGAAVLGPLGHLPMKHCASSSRSELQVRVSCSPPSVSWAQHPQPAFAYPVNLKVASQANLELVLLQAPARCLPMNILLIWSKQNKCQCLLGKHAAKTGLGIDSSRKSWNSGRAYHKAWVRTLTWHKAQRRAGIVRPTLTLRICGWRCNSQGDS